MKQIIGVLVLAAGLIGTGLGAPAARAAALIQTGSYELDPIYPAQAPNLGPIGVVSPGASLCGLAGPQVVTVGLPGHTASGPLFTMPGTVAGSPAFPAGFAVSSGGYILTGQAAFVQAGPAYPGEVYLTPVGGGPTATRAMNGIYDAVSRPGGYYASAAHGPDDHGNTTGVYGGSYGSGLYALDQSAGAISDVDLLFDTGTYSGAVAVNPGTGDLYFALGGNSATLSGAPHGFNDLWVIKAADIAAARGAGTISPAVADYVASINTGFNDGINGLAFDPAGGLLVGLTDYTGVGIDRIVRFDVNTTNALDYTSTFAGTVAEGTSSAVKILDFALDGSVLRITAVPEPGSAALLAVALAGAVCSGGRRARLKLKQ